MDVVKIAKFLCDLRREKGYTQERLGEKIGVTNKTISRWETGTYLPPVEMLQILSDLYGVSINEILSGERLSGEEFKQKADENIKTALEKSAFTLKDREKYFDKKWLKDHRFELVLEMIALLALAVAGLFIEHALTFAACILCWVWAICVHNRKRAYIERHLYNDKKDEEK